MLLNLKEQKIIQEGKWDLIIRSTTGFMELNLKELFRYKDLILLFVRRDFVSVYKQTILGPIWFVFQPLMTALTFMFVFGGLANIHTGKLPQFLFYMSSLVSWNYFADCVNKTASTFVNNASVFGKVYFPRLAVPVSVVISSMISFLIQFLLFLGIMLYNLGKGVPIQPNWYILLTPLLILIMAGLGLGMGIIISSLTTKYRDLRFLIGFGIQLMMYVSCVIFPLENITSPTKRMLILANPMSIINECFRFAYMGQGYFSWMAIAYCMLVTVVLLLVGTAVFTKVERNFMDTI